MGQNFTIQLTQFKVCLKWNLTPLFEHKDVINVSLPLFLGLYRKLQYGLHTLCLGHRVEKTGSETYSMNLETQL